MKKTILSILLTFIVFVTLGQNMSQEKGNCTFYNEDIDSANFYQVINAFDSLIYTTSTDELNILLNCLLSINPSEPKLYWIKASILISLNIIDTSDCRYFRTCINMGYQVGDSYYNIAASHINYLFNKMESDSTNSFSISERIQILDFAEKNMWLATDFGCKEAFFVLGEIQKIESEFLSKPLPEISHDNAMIRIVAKISDCGEFGGHIEQINIAYNNGEYSATFSSDSIYCMNEKARPSDNAKHNGIIKLLAKDRLKEFLNNIISFNENNGLMSNAPFEIAIIENRKVISKMIHVHWMHYLDFRREVFGF